MSALGSNRAVGLLAALLAGAGVSACGGWEAGDEVPNENLPDGEGGAPASCPADFDPEHAVERRGPRGFSVVGNEIHDSAGKPVLLRGVNRSGSEYACSKGTGFFDGAADEESVRAMARWNINAVRVPLNEACWLSLGGVSESTSGGEYKAAILSYVERLERYGLIPILDLHWAAPGDQLPEDLWPMPNADHTEEFWADVARTFLHDDGVIFEPYNEPFPDENRDSEAAWECWRDGCENVQGWFTTDTYQTVGMQALVDAIRATGSEHLILLGGTVYSNSLSRWLEYKPDDPLENLAAAWHIYNFNGCASESCWDDAPAALASELPIVVTELGQDDCQGDFVAPLIDWLQGHDIGYLAWSWNAFGPCVEQTQGGGNPFSLITDYSCPVPNGEYAATFYQALEDAR